MLLQHSSAIIYRYRLKKLRFISIAQCFFETIGIALGWKSLLCPSLSVRKLKPSGYAVHLMSSVSSLCLMSLGYVFTLVFW